MYKFLYINNYNNKITQKVWELKSFREDVVKDRTKRIEDPSCPARTFVKNGECPFTIC